MANIRYYEYDEEVGWAEIGIGTPYGMCYGNAVFNADEDKPEMKSEYISASIATYRAREEALRKKAKTLRAKYDGAMAVLNQIEGGAPREAIAVAKNFHKQWKEAKDLYEKMKKDDSSYCMSLLEEKQSWLDRQDRPVEEDEEVLSAAQRLQMVINQYKEAING